MNYLPFSELSAKTSQTERDWLKDHGRAERELAKVLRSYFDAQGSRIEKMILNGKESAALQLLIHFEVGIEHKRLVKEVFPTIEKVMRFGAHNALQQVPGTTKAFPRFKLPASVSRSVSNSMAALEKKSYWHRIQSSTSRFVQQHISKGIQDGLSIQNMAKSLRDAFNRLSRHRATAIARTETTMAMNNGHLESYLLLAENGLIEGKEWLAILDQRTREEHYGMNGVVVPVNEDFNVDGWAAPFPCHWDLPAYLRINCRCTTVPTFSFDLT